MTAIPSTTWRMLAGAGRPEPPPRGLDAAWNAAAGRLKRLVPRTAVYLRRAEKVLALQKPIAELTDASLRRQLDAMRERFGRGRDGHADLTRALALVREAAFRALGMRPYKVQVAGAIAMLDGCIAEMATGEGKTLTATMPATILGWRGRGCHVITVNDYLAQRDAEWMNAVYGMCGLTARHIDQEMDPPTRKEAYLADITYLTNKEVTADFLRDRLALGRTRDLPSALLEKITRGQASGTGRLVQRGLFAALVDEADSVLIDEAVTPLIISAEAPNPEQVAAFEQAAAVAGQLTPGKHYKANVRWREVDLTPAGERRIGEVCRPLGGLWHGIRRREELVTQALTAREFYRLDQQYVIDDGKVVIVDEFTGRLMPDREWRDGLHQAVMAKEKLKIEPPKDTCARISFQRFFRMYRRLCGMTGTAREATAEFWQIYRTPVAVVPTNKPCIRKHLPDRIFPTEAGKWGAIVDQTRRLHEQGRPVLVGTRSVRASEHLSRLLTAAGLTEHQVLNAVRHKQEAQIVAQAGRPGAITVATNMAGRGTDIKLGKGVADLGGLAVIATERHESGRVDRQLYGRAARQGDPGSCQAFVSLADELLQRHGPRWARRNRQLPAESSAGYIREPADAESPPDDAPAPPEQPPVPPDALKPGRELQSRALRRAFSAAQRRSEKLAYRQRRSVLQYDHWLDEHLGFAGVEA